MQPKNTILILSDEHNRDVLGCYGDSFVRTPNLDGLAARGARFSSGYCNSPVCVSSRASIASGRLPHQIGAWDSTSPYEGTPHGWARRLRDKGHEVTSIGKLHYRDAKTDCGFDPSLLPMHVHKGTGWLSSLLRSPPAPIAGADQMAGRIGAGETDYTRYDRSIAQRACEWIAAKAEGHSDVPWVLQVGFVAPHFPLIAPQEFYDLYEAVPLPPPRQYAEKDRPRHPVLDALRASSNYDHWFDEDAVRVARRAYYGLVSFLDRNIGLILQALDRAGLKEDTRIIYTSDHGDNLGHRGLWGKSVMYDDAVAVPLIMTGPDVPSGIDVKTPVSLVDLHPTLVRSVGGDAINDHTDLPGACLTKRFDAPDADRAVVSEYHDWSSVTGMFMLRTSRWKLVRYPGFADQLFDMAADHHETRDLAGNPDFATVLNRMRERLAAIMDVTRVNGQAFADQQTKIVAYGGADAILKGEELGYTPAPEARPSDGMPADRYEP